MANAFTEENPKACALKLLGFEILQASSVLNLNAVREEQATLRSLAHARSKPMALR